MREWIDPFPEHLPAIMRDVRVGRPISTALIGNADYLVAGDKALLSLGDAAAPLVIVSPTDFVTEVLDRQR